MAAPPNGRTEVVADLGLGQQLFEHVHDPDILLGRALDVAALPVHRRYGFCDFAWKFPLRYIRLISDDYYRDAVASCLDNLIKRGVGRKGQSEVR